jgi:hypothetical protein
MCEWLEIIMRCPRATVEAQERKSVAGIHDLIPDEAAGDGNMAFMNVINLLQHLLSYLTHLLPYALYHFSARTGGEQHR